MNRKLWQAAGVVCLFGILLVAAPEAYGQEATGGGADVSGPGWWTLLPPLLAILLALIFRQVVPALLVGIWSGAWIVHGGPFVGLLRTLDQYIVGTLSDSDRFTIVLFSLLLGGMVGVISRAGGTSGLVDALTPYATDSRRGQLVTWALGLLIFFDDYANTLIVGNTMRPVTDRLRVSREKLAYIVDSTAAPVASIGIISTWIGYEVSLIGAELERMGSEHDPYSIFLQSLPYSFYPVLALVFGMFIASSGRDFGPMLAAERRAREGRLLAQGAAPLTDFDSDSLRPPAGKPRRWFNAAIPVAIVLLVTFLALWIGGRQSLIADGDPLGEAGFLELGIRGIGGVFSAGDSYKALLYASSAGCLVALLLALGQRILTAAQGFDAWLGGIKSMAPAIVVLVLAWGIGSVCEDAQTSGFLKATLADGLDPRLLPTLVFLTAALTAFATGTSWATMAILFPLSLPLAQATAEAAGLGAGAAHGILLASVSAVLAGAIFGDHCSPISDTTVMSSMASGCDHIDHVRTQLPYALTVAVVAIVLGYLPAGFGIPPLLCQLVAALCLYLVLRTRGRPVQG
ncbi:MAG: Na+/H+ antiporter NhaC family protein [bacterium]|nr:Na+/H+ antiporter NhaC family protein [bacterium]